MPRSRARSAAVQVRGPLIRVEVEPSSFVIQAGESRSMRARGFDANGLEIPLFLTQWTLADPRAGQIDQGGFFTAGDEPGRYEAAIRVTAVEAEEE